jgi:eukaryotic-like serine/threonine-protein kinase
MIMTPHQWKQVKLLLEQLINLEPSQEKTYLDHSCQDEDVRKEVESLLLHHRKASNFLSEAETKSVPKFGPAKISSDQHSDNPNSTKLNNYKPATIQNDFRGTSRFLIQKRLGAGGFGIVYQAYDRERNSVVALKTLHDADAGDLYRFKKEFRALADLVHPNLVVLYELFSEQDQWFFTMELINGINFREYVKAPESGQRHCQANLSKLRAALKQLTEGLSVLHQAGKLHRDIKPSNVLVNREGRVVILDFGLVSDLTDKGVNQITSENIQGTPAYMSPEHALGRPISAASDWYSVGVMLYEALTGKLPIAGNPMEILLEKQRYNPLPPSESVSGIPDDLNTLCQDLLQRDPNLRPSGMEIVRIIGALDGKEIIPATATVGSFIKSTMPFVGREKELAILNEAWQLTKQGRSVTLYIKGRSGMGKSTIVRHFLETLESSEAELLVFSGRCYEQESVPYKALDSIIDLLSRYLKNLSDLEVESILPIDVLALARLFPVLRQVDAVANSRRNVLDITDSQQLRRKAFGALRELLARLGNKKDLILFIDDLQWGDLDSAALLSEILRPPDAPRLLLIGSYRSEEADTSLFLKSLFSFQTATDEKAEIREIAIEGLSTIEAQKLAMALLGKENALKRAEVIAQESGGSPFFINELAQYARTKTEAAQQETDNIEMTIDKVVSARIAQLPDKGRRLLEIVAVSGQPLARNVAKQAAEIETDEQILPILRSSHLLRSTSVGAYEEIDTYHDRIREAVITSLSSESQKNYHHCLAIALEAVKTLDAERLAKHFQLAGESEKACDYTITAAEQAAEALAFDRAAQLYQQTLKLKPVTDSSLTILKIKLGDALANAGKGADAAKAYLAASADSSKYGIFELQRKATEHFFNVGYVDEGMELLEVILNKAGMKLARSQMSAILSLLLGRAKLWLRGTSYQEHNESEISPEQLRRIDVCWTVLSSLGTINAIQRADFQTQHILLALNAGEPYRLARAFAFESGFSANEGRRNKNRTAKFSEMALSLAKRVNKPELLAMVNLTDGYSAFMEGRWQQAWESFCVGEKITKEQCLGANQGYANRGIDNALAYALRALFYLGDINQLLLRLPELLKDAKDKGNLQLFANLKTNALYIKHLAADEPDKAQLLLSQGSDSVTKRGKNLYYFIKILAEGEINLYSQAASVALEQINQQWPVLKKSLLLHSQFVLIEALHFQARAALAISKEVSDSASYLAIAEKNAKRIMREKTPYGDAWAELILAGVAAKRGNVKLAIANLDSAEKRFVNADMALYAAVVCRRRGELLAGDEGNALITTSDNWMHNQQIKDPARMTNMLAPGEY